MKTRMTMISATLAILFASTAFATAHADDASSMSIDDAAPIRAILLQTVSVDATSATSDANPPRMRIAETAPVEVTLLPTVHVNAREQVAEATLLPTIRVTPTAAEAKAAEEIAAVDNVGNADRSFDNELVDDESASIAEQPIGLQRHTMPR